MGGEDAWGGCREERDFVGLVDSEVSEVRFFAVSYYFRSGFRVTSQRERRETGLTDFFGTCSHDTNGDGLIEPGEMEASG